MSMGYDSGLEENESNSTSSANENTGDIPQEEKEIRIDTVVEPDGQREQDLVFGAGPSHRQDVFTFEMETGDTDDNEISDEEDGRIKRRKSSKKKFSSDLKVFSVDTDDDDDGIDKNKSQRVVRKGKKTVKESTEQHSGQEPGEVIKSTVENKVKETSPDENVTNAIENVEDSVEFMQQQETTIDNQNDKNIEHNEDANTEVTSF